MGWERGAKRWERGVKGWEGVGEEDHATGSRSAFSGVVVGAKVQVLNLSVLLRRGGRRTPGSTKERNVKGAERRGKWRD